MATIRLIAYDSDSVPLAALTPTWLVWLNAETGVDADEPVVTDRDLGEYGITDPPEDECGILDFGATANPRYVFVGSTVFTVIPAFSSDTGLPLAGLTPSWVMYKNVTGDEILPQPTFEDLGDGLYRIDGLVEGITGMVDFGATASPRRLYIDIDQDNGDEEQPVVSNLSPMDGGSISRTGSISFDVTDNRDLGRILVAIQYERFNNATVLVWDGSQALGSYTVEVDEIEGGWHFSVTNTRGWPAAPTVIVFAADLNGNEVV